MKKGLFLIVAICILIIPGISSGEVIVDTGLPTSSQAYSVVGYNIMGDPFWLSSKFSVNYPGYAITDVLGYIEPGFESKDLHIEIRGDWGFAPSDTIFCSDTFHVIGIQDGGNSGWYGLNGMTDCDLDPGDYWVVFKSYSDDIAGVHYPSPNPLSKGAVSRDEGVTWYSKDDLQLGIKINGIPFSSPSEPDIEVSPADHHFGDINVGSTSQIVITISNVGSKSLNVSLIDFQVGSSPNFVINSLPILPTDIPPANSLNIEINFSPLAVGESSATLEIHSDDPNDGVFYVTLNGTGIEAPPQYQIAFMHVQNRKIENGNTFNRLGFAMRSVNGEYPESNILTDVKLYDPSNNMVYLSNPGFQYYKTGYGRYDEEITEWLYPNLRDENYYSYEIQGNLVPGTYRLQVTDIYGVVHERPYYFNSTVDLPIISADTISWFTDEFRNFVLKWEAPINPPANTSVRAIIKIFNDDTFIGDFGMAVPTAMGYLPLPRWVLGMLQGFGNRLEFMVQLRTEDNNNRTYSNSVQLPPYNIGLWYVQHRRYEDGRDFYRLYLELNDMFGNKILVENAIDPESPVIPVILYDESNNEVPLINRRIYTGKRANGFYDGVNGNFSDVFIDESGIQAEISDSLTPGMLYRLALTDRNNQTLEGYYRFNGTVGLPIVSAGSFQTQFNEEPGDFQWQWQNPGSIPDSSSRAMIDIFNGVNYIGQHYIRVPTDVSQLVMPASFLAAGDRLKLRIQLGTNDNNDRTFSNLLIIPKEDADQDGIADGIDTNVAFSDDFSDGTTFGTITERGGQTLAITDAANPDGVLVSASGGTTPAQFTACDDAGQFSLDDGDEMLVTCGSVIVKIISGTVDVAFVATDGTVATAEVGAGNELSFDPVTFKITAPDTNVSTVIVMVDGDGIPIEPGRSKTIVEIDIKPGSETNCFNQNEHGVLPVAIFGSAEFDVNDINLESLSLRGLALKVVGKSNKYLAHYEYVNEDDYLDLVIQFEDSDEWVESGSDYATLSGELLDGTYIYGRDTISIVP